jgi:hypothetical protein
VRLGGTSALVFGLLLLFPSIGLSDAISENFLEDIRSRLTKPDAYEPTHIPLVSGDVRIDGVLDEAFWQQAVVWSLPFEIRAGQNREAPMDTYVLLASTPENLLVAFVNLDPDPHQIRGTFADRDRWNVGADDAVGLFIDTHGDQRNAYSSMLCGWTAAGRALTTTPASIFCGFRKRASAAWATSWKWPFPSVTCAWRMSWSTACSGGCCPSAGPRAISATR